MMSNRASTSKTDGEKNADRDDASLGGSGSSKRNHAAVSGESLANRATAMDSKLRERVNSMQLDLARVEKKTAKYENAKTQVAERIDELETELEILKTEESGLGIKIDKVKRKKTDLTQKMARTMRAYERRHSYYKYCKHLIASDPESSGLWYFSGNGPCCVCLEPYRNVTKINHCQHVMCEQCLLGVLDNTEECPLCRQRIDSFETFDDGTMTTRYRVVTGYAKRRTIAYTVPLTTVPSVVQNIDDDGIVSDIGTTIREIDRYILNGQQNGTD